LRFTVRRPASAEVSPCCHRPSGGDIACGVHVSMARARAAGDALENRLALAVFRRDVSAGRASLRRVRSGNRFEPSRSFVLEPGNQQSPALALNLAVEAPFLPDVCPRAFMSAARRSAHGTHLQILDTDGVEAARHIGGGLFGPVAATICLAGAHPGNGQLGSCPSVRSASRPGQTLLQSAQSLGFTSTKARNTQQLAGGQRHRHRHAAVNANDAPVIGPWNRSGDGGKSDVPAPRSIQIDAVGLHGVGDVAGPAEPHPTDFRYPYLPVSAAQPPCMTGFESDLAKPFMPAGLTPRRATVGAIEKVAHRLGEVPQRLLLHRLRPGRQPLVFSASHRQLRTLLVVTGRMASWLPMLLLLDRQIPHQARMATMLGQSCSLLRAGKQPKPAHINNVGPATDSSSGGGKRRLSPRQKPRVPTAQI
jgi:hypothetical protein